MYDEAFRANYLELPSYHAKKNKATINAKYETLCCLIIIFFAYLVLSLAVEKEIFYKKCIILKLVH